jgi:ribosome-binding factor A
MADNNRLQRIGDAVQRIVGQALITELNDARLKLVSITNVTVSRDLAHAEVLFHSVDLTADPEQLTKTLTKASGHLRKLLSKELKHLHSTPELHFRYDKSLEEGRRISSLIDEAVATDLVKGTP